MFRIGVHVSISNGFAEAIKLAKNIGCTCAQIFSHSPRSWRFTQVEKKEAETFKKRYLKENIKPIVVHESYLTNLATPKQEVYKKTMDAMKKEINMVALLGLKYLVIHPGAHLGTGEKKGLNQIIDSLNQLSDIINKKRVEVLLETTAGSGTNLGYTFKQLAYIIDNTDLPLGVTFDTCHVYAAGYNIATQKGLEETLEEFNNTVGLKRLKLIHLNDSLGELGSKLDRHEHIGMGEIGVDGFRRVINHESLRNVPMILETPFDERRTDIENIAVVKSLRED